MEPTLEMAKMVIEQLKAARPYCDSCETRSYADIAPWDTDSSEPDAFKNAVDKLRLEGWEHLVDRAGLGRRCSTCASARKYPWAERLDSERVLAHMKTKTGVWELSELEALL